MANTNIIFKWENSFFLLNFQLEDKTTARKRLSCMTVAEYVACEKSDNDDDDSDGGRIQELCDTGTKKPEDNKQFRLDVGLHTVNNETKDSKHSVTDGKTVKKVEKGRKLPSLVSSDDSEDGNNVPGIKKDGNSLTALLNGLFHPIVYPTYSFLPIPLTHRHPASLIK